MTGNTDHTERQEKHEARRWMKLLKRALQANKREREMGIRDARLPDPARLPR